MPWYYYIAGFFAGMFLANGVPHFVQGISGNKFPSPFAKPPGKGLSSPLLNVLWGLLNFVVGCVLFHVAKLSAHFNLSMVIFFIGILLMSIMLSINFEKKYKE
jgi:hypothetical protein